VLLPLLKRTIDNENDNIVTLFMDAVHLIQGGAVNACYCFARPLLLTSSGRKRFNVLGCIDSKTNETTVVSNDTYITSTEVVLMFKTLREKNQKKEINIILDNAKYQKCKLVQEGCITYNINLVYLPPYSPNLNLIERLWKFLRKECLSNKYYDTFKIFSEKILDCLGKTHTEYDKDLKNLLSHNFEIFK
jgi:transposase